jgi:aspartyl-tRNA(Asn)/glutamyl-tRNA(Gln) amidotransferase subunit A
VANVSEADLNYLTIAEASRLIDSRELSPLVLTEAAFARIDATDEFVHAFVRLMRSSALEEARKAERRALDGARLGPLDGIPIGVKDLFDTASVVTTSGLWAYRERVPVVDAACVRLLRSAGAVIVGKTNTHEMALGGTTNNPHYGATYNPWNLDCVPGGSSGGAGAALAAGQCLGALGTDTAGSIRIPAAFCGVTGHKPTYGLVSRAGVFALSQTLDHAGPLARSAEDAAIMLNALAGYDPADLDSVPSEPVDYTADLNRPIEGLRVAVIPSLVEGCRDGVCQNFERTLQTLRDMGAVTGECEPMSGVDLWRGGFSLASPEMAYNVRKILETQPSSISETIRNRLMAGVEASAIDYVRAMELRKLVEVRFAQTMTQWDVIAVPTAPDVAEPIDIDPPPPDKFRITTVFDLSRMPAVSVPNGFVDGRPTAVQFATAKFNDALALRTGHAYQQATDFHRLRPLL